MEVKENEICPGFLCPADGQCADVEKTSLYFTPSHYYALFRAITDVLLAIGNTEEIAKILLEPISQKPDWSKCLDRKNVWNQIRPAWFIAVTDLVKPLLPKTIKTTIDAIKTGASMYQAMSIILACFSYFWDCLDSTLYRVTSMIQDMLPSSTTPLSQSVLLQTLIASLYSELLKISAEKHAPKTQNEKKDEHSYPSTSVLFDGTNGTDGEIALALAEALCSIDEDNKHTDQIDEFLQQTKESVEVTDFEEKGSSRLEGSVQMCESLISDILTTDHGKQNLKILFHFVKNNDDWILQKLGTGEQDIEFTPNKIVRPKEPLLYTMFHIGCQPFDQVLSGLWVPDWLNLLQTPMGLSTEKVLAHINQRWEFRDINSPSLTTQDIQAINKVFSALKTIL
ncbi:hypothetical protein HHI36_020879 [Cryptolaemus montrouzieri]|uniref:Uncharacterized protein n=1 Tax=Cryptolaemus montrouzieri TaxID=559131 RepID=A0ABD2NCF1_9CUCU